MPRDREEKERTDGEEGIERITEWNGEEAKGRGKGRAGGEEGGRGESRRIPRYRDN